MTSVSQTPPLPGFGLDIDHMPGGTCMYTSSLFATALDPDLDDEYGATRMRLLTLREIAMVQFLNQVTDEEDWEINVFDEAITQKWKADVLEKSDMGFTKEMADYCIAELKYKAKLYKDTGFVSLYYGDVVKSDVAIPPDVRDALKKGVAPLESVPKQKQNWRPGSNDTILDLVDPSLFPLVYGLSRILTDDTTNLDDCIMRSGQGELVLGNKLPPKTMWETHSPYSEKFQRLPSDIDISGDTPKIVSYINNLHPKDHRGLYSVIESILARVIPVWNATLTPLFTSYSKLRIKYTKADYGTLEAFAEKEGPKRREGEHEYAFYDRQEEWKEERKRDFLVYPNPGPFVPPDEAANRPAESLSPPSSEVASRSSEASSPSSVPDNSSPVPKVDLKADYGKTGLQIIVKLTNIHLTPEKPECSGGTWHVEGQMNEHICATAIYYYDDENISTSHHLAFRQTFSIADLEEGISYEQNDTTWLEPIFGLANGRAAVHNVGSIEAREGRLVTFPSILQHQVQPFKLADPTKPGHRKILALFLVDPNIKIISTANIPCQQRKWWGKVVASGGGALGRLPVELRDKVVQDVEDFPISLDKAKKLREEMMEEWNGHVVEYQQRKFESCVVALFWD